jgi:HEAT repeat protein
VPDIREDQHPKLWSVLFSDDAPKRLQAIDILSKVNIEWPVPWFALLLADNDATVSAAAYLALKKKGSLVIPMLSLQRLSPLPKVRQLSVRMIGEMGDLSSIQDVIASLFDPVVDVREEGRRAVEVILNRSLDRGSKDATQRLQLKDLMKLFASLTSVSQRNVRSVMVASLLTISVENPDEFWEIYPAIETPGKNAIELEIISRPTPKRIDLLYRGLLADYQGVPEKNIALIERLLNKDTISDHVDSLTRLPPNHRMKTLRFLATKGTLTSFFEYFHWVRRDLRIQFLRLFIGEFGEEYINFQLSLLENPNPLLVPTIVDNFLSYERQIPYANVQGLLRHPSTVIKKAMLQYLYLRGRHESVRDLMPMLRDEDSEIVKLVIRTIARISRDYLIDHFTQLSENERRGLTQIMQRIDETFVESLTDILGGLDDEDRVHMTLILAELANHPVAQESIQALLSDHDERVRASAVRGFSHIPVDFQDDETIERMFKDSDPRVVANLIESLPIEKKNQHVERIEEAARSPLPRVRANAVLALFTIESPEAEFLLMQLLRHPDSWMRTSGLWVLARVDTPHLMDKALDLCFDQFPHVRVHALRAIQKKGNADMARQITPALSDPISDVREAAHLAIKAQMGLDYRS